MADVLRALCLIVLIGIAGPAMAQTPLAPAAPAGAASDPVEALREAGNTVIVVPPEQAPAADVAPSAAATLRARIVGVRLALVPILEEVPDLPRQTVAALREAGGGSLAWVPRALLVSAIGVAAAFAAWLACGRLVGRLVATLAQAAEGDGRAGRLATALTVLIKGIVCAAAAGAAGYVGVIAAAPMRSPEQVTGVSLVAAVAVFLAARTVLAALLSPGPSRARLAPFDDALATHLYRQTLTVVVIGIVSAGTCFWLANFPLAHTTHQLMLMVAVAAMMGLLAAVALTHRKAITAAILSPPTSRLKRLIAAAWLPLVLFYLAVSLVLNIAIIALSVRFLVLPTLSPLLGAAVGVFVAGALVLLYDRTVRWAPEPTAWSRLYHNGAAAVGALAALVVVLQFFPLTRYTGVRTGEVASIGLVLILLWLAWRSVEVWVAERLELEEPAQEGDHDEGMGVGTTRLATLLPILRHVAAFLVFCVGAMIVLASLGVNVGPLFAGAGVVGLAIGFGAQTLIRDVFSGAFFLFDDAFRRGEYVDVGGTTGAVERISLRSFQLRHHEGALHTIPFGEIKQLTNFSRDWVIMKLPMRLTYDTDVEKVRKLIKKLGQAMLDDPEIGPLFVEPLKSQGVIQMEDSAMIVRVKFKTTPGNQFVLRRHVYQRIRELFERENIHFAHREVTVRVAGEADEDVRRKAVLAAARDLDEGGTSGGAPDKAAASMR